MAVSDLHDSLTGDYDTGGPDQRETLRSCLQLESSNELQRLLGNQRG